MMSRGRGLRWKAVEASRAVDDDRAGDDLDLVGELDPDSELYWRAVRGGLWSRERRSRLYREVALERQARLGLEAREREVRERVLGERARLVEERARERSRRLGRRKAEGSEDEDLAPELPQSSSPSAPPPLTPRDYFEAWDRLHTLPRIRLQDLPLPIHGLGRDMGCRNLQDRLRHLDSDEVERFLLHHLQGKKKRVVLRRAYHWHPDRFYQKWGHLVQAEDRADLDLLVNRVAGILNDLRVDLDKAA